ncbi:uncharacterized protein LTR77_010216 [Saxophila tyrrhenica]|uniref:Choline monooxygenase, chloroplastic n=1 Tax=Saxophila tyrrhenica TaxID=1690608 RepID=A0AAV9NZZ2_9PEZI|nr:hypothetical protein LTR77_010216 [Saxophila tyrrhenica]
MAPFMNYFGLGAAPASPEPKEDPKQSPIRALPAAWFTSQQMYELERRAIFSKRWLFLTHRNRLQEAGDYLRYTIAGFDIIVIRDRSNNINAFHNVCRHRAYPVVEKKCGKVSILACRYHGWSYGLNGKLAKAPQYQELDGFDKSQNGLFSIHVHVDINGFIWINLDAQKEKPEVPWEADFDTVDKQERFEDFNFDDYVLDHTYELDGGYNWKIACDNFNECYHCPTTHPDVPAFLNVDSADVEVKDGHMQHDHASNPEQRRQGLNVNSTYYFPNVSMSVSPHFLMIQKFLPDSATKSTLHYEVYRNKNSSDEEFKLISEMYARVMAEDKILCDRAQKNLNAGVFVNGEMHPKCEKGPLYMQSKVRDAVTDHYRREKAAGAEIWPARQKLPGNALVSQEDIDMCNGLDCTAPQQEGLVW